MLFFLFFHTFKAPSGVVGEIQVVTPKMIYSKMPAKDAKAILGDSLYKKIRGETGLKAGVGHKIYEQWRELPDPNSFLSKKIVKQSIDYYSKLI